MARPFHWTGILHPKDAKLVSIEDMGQRFSPQMKLYAPAIRDFAL
jgi:hypothetical protein